MTPATVLVLIATAAFILPIIARVLHVPGVVLEIAFGIVVGPEVLGIFKDSELIDLLAELGFFLLMFLSGFEIDFTKLERQGRGPVLTALLMFVMSVTIAFISAKLLGYGVFMTFVLATTSVGLVVPTLRSTRYESAPIGQAILIGAIFADFATLLGVTVFALVQEHGGGFELMKVPGLFLVLFVVLFTLRRAAWWFPEKFERLFSTDDPEELGIRASLALMLVFVGVSELFGVESILGAFLAGSVFAVVFRHRAALETKLNGFGYGFLIPIFFISVGIRFQLGSLASSEVMLTAMGLFVAAIAVKMVPALILYTRRFGLRGAVAAGTLLSARLSLIIAVAELGVVLGLIDRGTESAIVLLALVTTTFAPALFRIVAPPIGARRS